MNIIRAIGGFLEELEETLNVPHIEAAVNGALWSVGTMCTLLLMVLSWLY